MFNRLVLSAFMAFLIFSLAALPENQLVTISGMGSPLAFNEDENILYGTSSWYTGVYKWTEENGVVTVHETFMPQSVSPNGYVAGELLSDQLGYNIAGYLTPDGEYVEIGNFNNGQPMDTFYSTAYAVNHDGTIFGGMGWIDTGGVEAFKWTQESGIIDLNPTTDVNARVNCMNGDGSSLYGWYTADFGNRMPVRWDDEGMTIMNTFNDSGDGEVLSVSHDGNLQCGTSAGLGAVWTESEEFFFGEPDYSSVVASVSNNGVAVGVERNFMMWIQNGIIWSEATGKMTIAEYLELFGVVVPQGYSLNWCGYISPDGSLIAGTGSDANWNAFTWFVKLGTASHIQGNIVLNGDFGSVGDVTITNGTMTVHPDINGNYDMIVPAGTYTLTASLTGYYNELQENIVVEAEETVTGVDFVLEPFTNPSFIEGHVDLISYYGVVTDAEISAGAYSVHPDESGNYQLIVPAGTYSLSATLEGHIPVYIPEQEYVNGQTYLQDFTIYAADLSEEVFGTVFAEGVTDFSHGRIQSYYSENIWSTDGSYSTYLTLGNHDIICYLPGFQLQSHNITVNYGSPVQQDFNLIRNYYYPKEISLQDNVLSWQPPYAPQAIFDDFEEYNNGDPIGVRHPFWFPVLGWFGEEYDPQISENQLMEGEKNLFITGVNDAIFDLMNTQSGVHRVDFDILVPEGFSGHYNLLHDINNITMGIEVFFRTNGTAEVLYNGQQADFSFNHNEVIHISNEVNLDNNTGKLYMNGLELVNYIWNYDSFSNQLVENPYLAWLDLSAEVRPGSSDTGSFYFDNFAYYRIQDIYTEAAYNVYLNDFVSPVAENITEPEFAFTNLVEGTAYQAGVQAYYPDGNLSEIRTFSFVYNGELLLPPLNVNVNAANGLITWNPPQRSLTGYNVYLDDNQVAANITTTQFQLTGLVNQTTYIAGISAVYDDSLESAIVEVEFIYDPVDAGDNIVFVTELKGNYPNPFNPETTINFSLADKSPVAVEIYNIKGQKVKTLIDKELAQGMHSVTWKGTDDYDKKVSSGVFFCKMTTGDYSAIRKMVLLK